MQVRHKLTNVIYDIPFAWTIGTGDTAIEGQIIIDDGDNGDEVFFVYGVNVDPSDDKMEVFPRKSMFNDFSLDLTVTDPEGEDPEVPPTPLNCALTELVQANPSRTFSSGKNYFKLWPLVTGSLEFATELQGITKAGAAIVNIEYYSKTKETDGSYIIEVNATGLVETILIRQVGCSSTTINPNNDDFFGGRFHAYQTDSSGTVTPPSGDKIYVPIGAYSWEGFYEDYELTPRQGIDGATYDQGINPTSGIRRCLTEFSSANVVPFYGEQNLSPESIDIITNVTWNPTTSQNDLTVIQRDVTCRFNMTSEAMKKQIGFAKDGGIDFIAFLWYSPYDTPMGEGLHKFIQLSDTDKQGMKMCFTSGPIGWDITKNVNYIVDKMTKTYYQRIDNKPLFICEAGWPHLETIRNAYRNLTGGELYISIGNGYNDYPASAYDCSSIYNTYPSDGTGEVSHQSIIDTEIATRNHYINTQTKDILPCLTTGGLNYIKRYSLEPEPFSRWYAKPTAPQWTAKMEAMIDFINSNPSRVKAIMFYSLNENHESGNPICPTLASGTTSVTVSSLNTAGANTGVNRETLDYIKPYCKK